MLGCQPQPEPYTYIDGRIVMHNGRQTANSPKDHEHVADARIWWDSGSSCWPSGAPTGFVNTVIDPDCYWLTEHLPHTVHANSLHARIVQVSSPQSLSSMRSIRRHAVLPPSAKFPSQPPGQPSYQPSLQQRQTPPTYLAPIHGCALEESPCQELQATLHSRRPCA
jgi:hypothetical protein